MHLPLYLGLRPRYQTKREKGGRERERNQHINILLVDTWIPSYSGHHKILERRAREPLKKGTGCWRALLSAHLSRPYWALLQYLGKVKHNIKWSHASIMLVAATSWERIQCDGLLFVKNYDPVNPCIFDRTAFFCTWNEEFDSTSN